MRKTRSFARSRHWSGARKPRANATTHPPRGAQPLTGLGVGPCGHPPRRFKRHHNDRADVQPSSAAVSAGPRSTKHLQPGPRPGARSPQARERRRQKKAPWSPFCANGDPGWPSRQRDFACGREAATRKIRERPSLNFKIVDVGRPVPPDAVSPARQGPPARLRLREAEPPSP